MTRLEKIELAVIAVSAMGSSLIHDYTPPTVSLGQGFIWIAALMFIQSLIRDLAFIADKANHTIGARPQSCFCFETLISSSVLLIGFLLFFSPSPVVLEISKPTFIFAVGSVLVIGFLIKDLVFTWRPLGVRREKNHMDIIVKW